jgi:hypothetical protein
MLKKPPKKITAWARFDDDKPILFTITTDEKWIKSVYKDVRKVTISVEP